MSRIEPVWWKLVRFGFRLLYNEFAWTYDLVSWGVSLGHWRKWQRAAIPYLHAGPDDLMLELAHGTANLQIDLANEGLSAIGLDLSPYMGHIARRKLSRIGKAYKLVRASALNLPFADSTFRAVVSTFPTEFIVYRDTLREVFRVLEPNGNLVVIPNGMLTLANPLVRFLEWLYQVTGQRGPWPSDPLVAFREAGFDAKMITEELPGSQAWVIIAKKATTPTGAENQS